jgi:hypothetical protein
LNYRSLNYLSLNYMSLNYLNPNYLNPNYRNWSYRNWSYQNWSYPSLNYPSLSYRNWSCQNWRCRNLNLTKPSYLILFGPNHFYQEQVLPLKIEKQENYLRQLRLPYEQIYRPSVVRYLCLLTVVRVVLRLQLTNWQES